MDFGGHDYLKDVRLNEIGVFFGAAGEVSHVVKMNAGDVKSTRGENFDVFTESKMRTQEVFF